MTGGRRLAWLGVAAALWLAALTLAGSLVALEPAVGLPGPQVAKAAPLPAGELLRRIADQRPGLAPVALTITPGTALAARAWLAPGTRWLDVDPRDGRVLDPPAGRSVFDALRGLQAWAWTMPGRALALLAALVMAAVCIAGWRRDAQAPLRRAGWLLIGAAVLVQVAASIAEPPPGIAASARADSLNRHDPGDPLADAWSWAGDALAGEAASLTLLLPAPQLGLLRFEIGERGDGPLALGRLDLDAASGEPVTVLRHADLPWRERWAGNAPAWRDGSAGGAPGLLLMALAAVLMPVFSAGLRRRPAMAAAALPEDEPLLVAYASQTGNAERIAQHSAEALRAGGIPARVRDLALLTRRELQATRRALFIIATTGHGEAPDHARPFERRLLAAAPALDLRYGLLALGDSRYEHYCGFGRTVAGWLQRAGAEPLFAPIDVDGGDPSALARWRSAVQSLGGGTADASLWREPGYARWRLAVRRRLNPGSAGLATFHVELQPTGGAAMHWQAGDIAEIRCGDTLREYSIASLPADGAIHLLVRQARRDDGSLGLGSGWLTAGLPDGGELDLRVRSNAGFHAPPDDRPLILIGNGTGLAGLRAHLRARAAAGHRRNWLVFGERHAAHDYYHRDEIEAWQQAGVLQRVDLAFSRDQPQRLYVQHRLHAAGDALRAWLADGAAIYVCGSSVGMAPEVEAVLTGLIGAAALDALVAEGRYRRDVY